MISACSSHPANVRDTLCLSLQCKDKGLVCAQCASEKHHNHYSVSLAQFKDSLSNNTEINDATAVLLQQVSTFQEQVDGKHQSLVGSLLEIQRKFNQEIESLIKLYHFNKDFSFKIMNKIQNFLENMNKLSDVTKEEELSDLVTYFSLMVYEKESQTFENNLKDHLEAMSTKCGTISSFFSKHEASILESCSKVEESIRDLMYSEVDILQILEIQRYEADPDAFKILVAREKDFPKKFAIIDAKKSQIDSLETIVSRVFENFGLNASTHSSVQLRHPDSHHPISQLDELQGYNSVIAELTFSPQQVSPLYIIGITGSTRCGKSTLSQQLSLALNADVLHQDLFFDKEKIHSKLHGNWESEESIDWVAFKQFVEKEVTKKKAKGGYLIIEGIQLFCQEWMRKLCDVKYFLEIDEMTMYVRRMRTTAVPEHYFWNTIVPEYKIYKGKIDGYQSAEADPNKKIVYLNAQDSPQQLFQICLEAIRQ